MRELKITITADAKKAMDEFYNVDKATAHLDKSFAKAEKTIGQVETALSEASVQAAQVEKTFTITGAGIGKVLTGVGTALAAFNLRDLATESVKKASDIQDAMQRMGITSAEAVQRLAFAAKQGGASLGTVDIALKEMAKSLTGDKAAEKLIADLGLNLEALRAAKPEDTFLTLTDAVQKIPNPLDQARATLVLFGRSGTELLPAIRDGFREVGNTAPVMSTAVVAAGDKVGDKLQEMQDRMDTLQAQALLPFAEFFLDKLPTSVQVSVMGLSKFFPSLETIALGIFAAGGPKAALEGLVTLFGTTLPGAITGFITGAGAAIVTFVTVTLPEAFVAVMAFLGPQGLIAVALLALAGVWYLWGDKIKDAVSKAYTAIKEWLGEKLGAIFDTVKGGVTAVTDAFATMYDKVVGHSYVPDMVTGVGAWFAKLPDLMIGPAEQASSQVTNVFARMANTIGASIGSAILGGGGGVSRAIGSSVGGMVGGALGNLIPIPGVGALLGSAAGAGVQKLASWIGGLFGKSDMNKHRDEALMQFTGINDLDQASDQVRQLGFAAGISDDEMRSLFSVKKVEDFDKIFRHVSETIMDFNLRAAQSIAAMKEELATPVVIPVTFGMLNPGLGGSGANNTDMFNPRNFASFEDWKANYLLRNPGDEHRLEEALGGYNPWGTELHFAEGGGVPGRGARRAVVHGGEGVLNPKGMEALDRLNKGGGTGMDLSDVHREMKGLRADLARDRETLFYNLKAAIQMANGRRAAQA